MVAPFFFVASGTLAWCRTKRDASTSEEKRECCIFKFTRFLWQRMNMFI